MGWGKVLVLRPQTPSILISSLQSFERGVVFPLQRTKLTPGRWLPDGPGYTGCRRPDYSIGRAGIPQSMFSPLCVVPLLYTLPSGITTLEQQQQG